MTTVVNLRTARKRAKRAKDDVRAQDNRVAFGIAKAERDKSRADAERTGRALDQHRREGHEGDQS